MSLVFNNALALARRSVEEAWIAGQLLNQVKADLPHGKFLPWLEENGIARRTAQRFMKLNESVEIRQLGTFESVSAALSPPKKEQSEGEKERKSRVDHAREKIRKIRELGKAVSKAGQGFKLDNAFMENALTLKALNLYRKIESGKLEDVDAWTEADVREFMGMEDKNKHG